MTESSANVFVVDDDAVSLFTLSSILRGAGYAVSTFDHPAALLARLTPHDRGAVVLDLKMPVLNGLELQAVLGKRGIRMPMIFVSGRADIPAAVTAMKQGALDFLPKPVEPQALLAGVAQALQKDAQVTNQQVAADLGRERWAALSQREQDVCRLSAQGLLIKQIADRLGTTESTVQAQRARAWKKLGISSAVELARLVAQVAPVE